MSTEVKLPKPPRTKVEIEQDYGRLCSRLGHATYQVHVLTRDIELMQNTLRDLNLEAASVAKLEAEAAKPQETANAQSN